MRYLSSSRRFFTAALFRWMLASVLATAISPATGCGFHGAVEGNWIPLYPGSIEVALAVREAADRKIVDAALLQPQLAGPLGYVRASKRLRDLGLFLAESAGKSGLVSPVAFLFVESGLWSRHVARGMAREILVHVEGPQPGDAVVVTSEAVIAAILDGRLSFAEAISQGMLMLGGGADAAGDIQTLFQRLGRFPPRTTTIRAVR